MAEYSQSRGNLNRCDGPFLLHEHGDLYFLLHKNIVINNFFETDFTIKVHVKKQRRFDRSTVIFKLKSKNLCDTDYVGFTCRHLHQRVDEHKRSTIGYHVKDEHGGDPDSIGSNFEILKKCQNKLDCLIFEMLFIRKLKPKLSKQSDSIRAKLFT